MASRPNRGLPGQASEAGLLLTVAGGPMVAVSGRTEARDASTDSPGPGRPGRRHTRAWSCDGGVLGPSRVPQHAGRYRRLRSERELQTSWSWNPDGEKADTWSPVFITGADGRGGPQEGTT